MSSEEIAAVVEEIRQRVRARYEKQVGGLPDFCLPSLAPLGHARDAAEGKVAAIGTVNPRPPGPVNSLIQGLKKLVARSLGWHVREQVEFNRAVIAYMDRVVAVMEEQNRHLLMLAGLEQHHREAARRLDEWHSGWQHWRGGWEERWNKSEIQFLRTAAELEAAFHHRVNVMDTSFREHIQTQHADYLGALDRATLDIQKRMWEDLARLRQEHERMIHTELRLIRQRAEAWLEGRRESPSAEPPRAGAPGPAAAIPLDYMRFAERFRGSADHVAAGQKFYLPFFQGRARVIDLGCGRGEFLELMKKNGIGARGIDLDGEAVALCRQKALEAEQADLFQYLAGQPAGSLDGVFSAQVVEHLAPDRVPEVVRLASQALERGGILAIETPNPECLAIFATNFFIDPTHVRPVPSALLHFYFEENGLGGIEVHQLAPAAEVFPEIAALAGVEAVAAFQNKFLGGMDYAIIGRKL